MKRIFFTEPVELPISRESAEEILRRFRFPGILGNSSVSSYTHSWTLDEPEEKNCIVVGDRTFKRQMEIGIKSEL